MKLISLTNVCPHIFATRNDLQSEVWLAQPTFEQGKFYLVEAQSGGGKSSLCSYLMGYRCDYAGSIYFDGTDVRRYGIADWVKMRQRHISMLFQDLRLFPELTALENIEIKNRLTQHKRTAEIEKWFDALGIADKMHTAVGRMSFGQQQRVALIRCLVQPFDFLLADEAVSHLDEHNAHLVGELLTAEAHRQGAAIVATSVGLHVPLKYDQILQL